ncbi:glycosyltransferase family 4 protein [Rhodococcus chondri]|uniref:Glycosyltransferase family 4 protein n=1 Tax=Rhodococcus chondri TaxID=3065941 RepID=A0ABU7JSD4_9NOCA|nr:glycosyltransferase family 4 protein [Rhodococcus sp. CC-R104]MEE2032948.1 glycosyltransferase family 4 protein [Rhodococcus sp. CC-R104]
MRGRPLRIALIASNRHPIRQPFAGGLEAHVWHLANALGKDGHDVTLYAAPGSDPDLPAAFLEVPTLDVSDLARSDVSMPATAFLHDHHAYLSLMLELAGPSAASFDIVHNHSLHYLPIAMAPALRTPLLCTLHTPPTPWLESAMTVPGGCPCTFVAVSRHTAAAWEHATPGPVAVVPNGVDLTAWPAGPGGPDLIWFGRLVHEKGPDVAIEAARRAGYRLRIAGPISDREYFATRIEPLLGPDVTYLGHLPQSALAAAVGSSAATLVTPRWDEPYGLVVAESLACGTPVVAFARGGIPEVLDDRSGCLVEPDDIDGVVAAVPRAVALSRTDARSRAADHCSERTMVDAYLDLYRRLSSAGAVR